MAFQCLWAHNHFNEKMRHFPACKPEQMWTFLTRPQNITAMFVASEPGKSNHDFFLTRTKCFFFFVFVLSYAWKDFNHNHLFLLDLYPKSIHCYRVFGRVSSPPCSCNKKENTFLWHPCPLLPIRAENSIKRQSALVTGIEQDPHVRPPTPAMVEQGELALQVMACPTEQAQWCKG